MVKIFSALYKSIISIVDIFIPNKLKPVWDHPAGPKTIFFWAPTFKWGLVLAGLGDILERPIEYISIPQTLSLTFTGAIWSRYSLVIKPINYNLFSVNVFIFTTNTYLLLKALKYNYEKANNKE